MTKARSAFDAALGERLRHAREESGRTAEDIAQQARSLGLGWHRPTVGQVEQGKRSVAAYELVVLASVFGTTVTSLVDGLPTPEPAAAGPDEATVKAARRLRVDPVELDAAARRLWGRGLSAEREARLGVASRSRGNQARRGHVTRALIAELQRAVPTA